MSNKRVACWPETLTRSCISTRVLAQDSVQQVWRPKQPFTKNEMFQVDPDIVIKETNWSFVDFTQIGIRELNRFVLISGSILGHFNVSVFFISKYKVKDARNSSIKTNHKKNNDSTATDNFGEVRWKINYCLHASDII